MPANIVTISQYVANPDAQLSDDSVLEVRGFYTRDFISGDAVTPIYGNTTNGQQGPYTSITATLNASGKVVVAAHDVEVTTLSNPTARYFEILFVDNAPSQIFIPNTQGATGWQVPSVYGSPINYGELALYNRAQRLVYPPPTYFTADQTIQEIDLRAGQFDYAAVNHNGIGQPDVAPDVASQPIWVGINSPRVNPDYPLLITVPYSGDGTAALAKPLKMVGANAVLTTTTDRVGCIGIGYAGETNQVTVAVGGLATALFDSDMTGLEGYYAVISPTSNGLLHAVAAFPGYGQAVGRIRSVTNFDTVGIVDVFGSEVRGEPLYYASNYASFNAAVTAIGSTAATLVVSASMAATTLTAPATLQVQFVGAGALTAAISNTVTLNGPIIAPPKQIFSGLGKFVLGTAANPVYQAAWWGETTVTVPGPVAAPTLIAGTVANSAGTFTDGVTYQIAYTYAAWNGETGISPVSSFVAKNEQALAVKPLASLANNSKYAVGSYVYISPDAGANWYRGDAPFQRPGLVSFGDDTAGWGGVLIDYANTTSGSTPPAPASTTTTKSGLTVPVPASAPTLTNIAANAAGTYYGAYSYLCADGTETALSPVSTGLTIPVRRYIRIQRNEEPPSGAVAVRLYVGTVASAGSMHLQSTVALDYVTGDVHDYNSSGAIPSAGTAQSPVCNFQLAYDAMMASGSAGKIIDLGGVFQSPMILRLKNASAATVPGIQIEGEGGHASIYTTSARRRYYTGTQTNNVVGVLNCTSVLEWRSLDVRDPSARLTVGRANCDFSGAGGFESKWFLSTFEGSKAGVGVGDRIACQSAMSGSHTTSEQHSHECNLIGDVWGIDIHGGQTIDIRYHSCEFYTGGNTSSANSGQARIAAPVSIDSWEGTGPTAIGYDFFITGDSPHVYTNVGSLTVREAALDANAGSATSYLHVSAAVVNQVTISLRDSKMNTNVSDRYALYSAAPVNFVVSNTTGGGNGWINWINKNDGGSDRVSITSDANDTYFGLGSTYGFQISTTSDTGSGVNKANIANVIIGGYRLGNAGANNTTGAQLLANTNNYNPPGRSYIQRWSTDASRNITGLNLAYGISGPQISGEEHLIINVGAQDVVLKHQDTNSDAANRFLNSTASDITLTANQSALAVYDGTTARWRVAKMN